MSKSKVLPSRTGVSRSERQVNDPTCPLLRISAEGYDFKIPDKVPNGHAKLVRENQAGKRPSLSLPPLREGLETNVLREHNATQVTSAL